VAQTKNDRGMFRVIVLKSDVDVERRTGVGWVCIRTIRLGIGTGDGL